MSAGGPVIDRRRLAIAAAIVAVVAIAVSVTAPLRHTSGDTVAGRLGGAVLRCTGSYDLSRIDWIHADTIHDRGPYYLDFDRTGETTSIFGPAPAVVAAIAYVGTGDSIDEATLRSRERWAAAILLALSAALLVIAAGARVSPIRAAICGLVAVLSFAGAATLGQALWQASIALPFLAGALAILAWRDRAANAPAGPTDDRVQPNAPDRQASPADDRLRPTPRLAIPGLLVAAVPALLVAAVLIRPTIVPLAFGLGIAWAVPTRDRRTWLIAIALAVIVAAPFVWWNAIHYNSPLPLGQWRTNIRDEGRVFSLRVFASGFAGLVASPARGIAWFAPLALVGVWAAIRERRWYLLGTVLAQLLFASAYQKWHGGLAFGPRMLAEAAWIAIYLALTMSFAASLPRALVAIAAALTVVVGAIGLWLWTPDQWETRRRPETEPSAYWDVSDSPILSAISPPDPIVPTRDMPARGLRCTGDTLTSF